MSTGFDRSADFTTTALARPASLRVLCCVAGGSRIGMGHVSRSLELARALEAVGVSITGFACNDDLHSRRAILASGWLVWSDAGDDLPLRETDVLLVDCPDGLGEKLKAWRRWHKTPVVALDRFDMETCDADLVINLINHHPTMTRPRSPAVGYVEGVGHAIIRPEFLAARAAHRRVAPCASNVIVSFGGADPQNRTGLVLDAVALGGFPGKTVRVVVGANFSRAAEVKEQALRLGVEAIEGATHLASLFAGADLAVSGGGTTMLELACVGTPTLVLPQTAAELRFAESLAARRAVRVMGGDVTAVAVQHEIGRLVDDRAARAGFSAAAMAAVDGLGARRIADLIIARFTAVTATS
jgi:spore coat polysaccharide biosynthesis predicted glycosyltransferase SpsG